MPDINLAYQWAIEICNAPNIGYSQAYRNQQTVDGITYYDCSSFINYSINAGGFITPDYAPDHNAFTTFTMGAVLLSLGFVRHQPSEPWLPGDILVRNNAYGEHTEMVYRDRYTMGAHGTGYPLADQVSIKDTPSNPATWDDCYRYEGGVVYNWIAKNEYLTLAEMQNNAIVQYGDLTAKGWSLNAIAGLLGNEQQESNINPGLWQNLDEGNYSMGFGLVQWTPATNFTGWATSNGYDINDGYAQDIAIDTPIPAGQWIPTAEYPMSLEEFKVSDDTPENLASAWLKNFERAGVEVEKTRRENARYWYNYLQNIVPPQPGMDKPIPDWNVSYNIQVAFMSKQTKRRNNHESGRFNYLSKSRIYKK